MSWMDDLGPVGLRCMLDGLAGGPIEYPDEPGGCWFCDSAVDLLTCDAAEPGYVRTTYGQLVAGDKVRRLVDKTGRPPATVESIRPAPGNPDLYVTLQIRGKIKLINVYRRSPVLVLRDRVPCARACCDLHRCERGPGATYCASHWTPPAVPG